MLGRSYEDQTCSISRTLEVIGERWTVLILRDVFLGLRRFGGLQQSLGIARNVLTDRLNWLVEAGILERVAYQDHPVRYEYQLTEEGSDLFPVLLAMMHWGDRHRSGAAGRPRLTTHAGCGGDLVQQLTCTRCSEAVPPDRMELLPGPALTAHA